ncbi:MAG: sugar ABC transporter permease [Chloroflexi bacterium]|nr:sugar ABC transporter permease [Chloroflexota bacterium]
MKTSKALNDPLRRPDAGKYGLLAPYLAGALLLVCLPALLSFAISLTRYDALSPPVWAGLQNFVDVYYEPLFWVALNNSLFYIVLAVPLRVLGALALALLLNKPRRGVGFYRAAVYLPSIIPETAYALIWLWIFNPLYGPLNLLLSSLGLPTPAWLVEPATARPALVLMSLFQIGEGFVVLLAGLRDISPECIDSAKVDGANRWQLFRWVTLPLLAPWLTLLTFRDVILSLQSTFTPAYIMTGGGPYYRTFFAPLLIYEEAFDRFRFGQGAAVMLLVFLVTLGLLLLLYGLFEGWGHNE